MRRLPLFVLPSVLYPGTIVPLHVFEPRYRRMVAQCLEGDRRFGFLFHDFDRTPAFTATEGRVGCLAEITQFTPLPDGRSLVLASGLERFRIVDGIESDTPYHEALVEEFDDVDTPSDLRDRRSHTIAIFREVLHRLQAGAGELPDFDLDTDVSFILAAVIQIEPQWKQMLLELRLESERLLEIEVVLGENGRG